MKSWLKFEAARSVPAILALVLIYALSSIAAAHSFAQIAPGASAASGLPAAGVVSDESSKRGGP